MTRLAKKIRLNDLKLQWSEIAVARACQIESGNDLSFTSVLVPAMKKQLRRAPRIRVVDVGCGTGHFTRQIAHMTQEVVGVDMSPGMLKVAEARPHSLSTSFKLGLIEELAPRLKTKRFDTAIANMMLMTAPALAKTVRSIATILRPQGHFIVSITHPIFWPIYWGYDREKWFNYGIEMAIEAPFRVTLDNSTGSSKTVHFHRPLEQYVETFLRNDFEILALAEPFPKGSHLDTQYLNSWKFPRFLIFHLRKLSR